MYWEIPTNLPSRSIQTRPRKDRLKNCWRELSPAAKNLGSTVRRPKQQRDTAGELASKKARMPRQVPSSKEKRRKGGKPAARCDIYIRKASQPHVPEAFRFFRDGGNQGLTKGYRLLREIGSSRDLLYRYGALPGGTVGRNDGRLWAIKSWLANPLRYWRTTSHASPYRRKSQKSIYENRLTNNPCA